MTHDKEIRTTGHFVYITLSTELCKSCCLCMTSSGNDEEITDKSINYQLLQSDTQGFRLPSRLEVRHTRRHCMCSRSCCLAWRENATKQHGLRFSSSSALSACVQQLRAPTRSEAEQKQEAKSCLLS